MRSTCVSIERVRCSSASAASPREVWRSRAVARAMPSADEPGPRGRPAIGRYPARRGAPLRLSEKMGRETHRELELHGGLLQPRTQLRRGAEARLPVAVDGDQLDRPVAGGLDGGAGVEIDGGIDGQRIVVQE